MKTNKGKGFMLRKSSLFGLTALLTLAGCAQKAAPAPETVAVTPNAGGSIIQKLGKDTTTNTVSFGWNAQSVSTGNYLSVPITIETLKEVKAVDLQFLDLPIGVDLVGVQDEEGLFGQVSSVEGSQTERATVFFDSATRKHTVKFIFKVDTTQNFSLQSKVSAVVNADGTALPMEYTSNQSVTIGEGGQGEQPKLSDLQERIQQASAQSGEIQAQAYPGIYKVPTVIQKEWKDFEPGDLNQDHRVDVADEVILIGFLLKNSTPTPYQLYAADLDEKLIDGEKVINGYDYWAAVAKSNLTNLKIVKEKPFVQPLAVKANEPNPAIVLAGNAGYGPVVLKVEPSEPWITVTEIPTYNVSTHAYEVRTNAPEGSKGFITVTYSNGEKRRVDVTALAPPAAPAVPPTVVGGTPGEFTGIGGQFTLVMVLEDKDGKPITEALANENFTFKDVTLAPTATPTEVFTTGEAVPVKVENGGKVESGPVSMMIAIDQSGSMSDNDPQRLRYTAATELIDTLKAPDEVGVMSLDTVTQKLTQDYGLAKQAVTRGGGSSDIYGGVRIGVKELASAQHTHKAIVALTDGETGLGNFEASIKEANDARINVYTVGLGNNLNYKELQDLASRTGGAFAHVQNANDLQNVFNAIGRSIQQGGTRVTGQVKLNQGISKVGTYILSGTVVTTVRGQTFETPFSVRVYVDGKSVIALPPVVQSLSPKTGSTKGGVAVVIRGTDLSRVNKVMFGAVPATNFTVNSATQITAITPAQAPGDVQVTVESPEGTSNVSTYTYVNQAPSIGSLRVSKASPLINEEVTFSFSVSDNDGNPTSCVLDFGDGQTQELASCSGNQTVKHTYAAAGSFTAKLTVKDAPGATSTRNVAVRVLATPPNTAPKIASLTANPASPVAGVATAIGFTVSDAENDAVSCVVDFGDGQTQNLTSCAGVQNLSHTYEKEGRYTIKVTAKDAAGSSQQTAVVTVQPKPLNQAPVINAFAATPASPVAGQQVSFSLNVSDPENDAVSCVVDFGDGQTQNLTSCAGDQAIAAIYTVAGTYTATVTATDARGAWSAATVTITVSATPVNTAPLIQTFEVSPVSVNEFEPVTAKWQAIDPDNDAITCTVDFGDGYKTEAMDCSQMTSHVHRYAQAGQYQISVNTTDSRGATAIASSKTIQVMAVTPPVGVTISGVTKDLTPYRDAVYQLDGIKVLQERKTRASLNLNMTTAALYQDGEFEVLNAVDRVPNRNVLAIFKNGVLLEAFLTTWDIEKRDGNDIRITNLRTGKSAYASPNTDSFTAAYREILSESNSNLISRNATSFQSHSIIAQSSSFNCISPTGEAACKSAATELAEKAKGFAEEWGPFAATNYICVGFEVSFIPTVAAGFAINTPTMCAAEMGWSFGKALKNVEAMMGARQELISCMKSNMPTLQTGSRVAAFLTPMPLSTYALIQNEDGMNFGTSTYIMPPSLPINFSLGSQDWPEEYLFIFDKLVSDSVKEKIDDKIAQILFGDIVTEQAAYGLSRAVPNVVEVFETLNDVKVTNITVDGEMQAIILGYCRK